LELEKDKGYGGLGPVPIAIGIIGTGAKRTPKKPGHAVGRDGPQNKCKTEKY